MFYNIEVAINFVKENLETFWLVGVIMVSAITVLIGILKPLLFNRIPWKPLRRATLAFANVGLCFATTAVWFAIKNFSFGIYWHSAIAVSVFSIVWYWFYENTCLRDLISTIGKITLRKIAVILAKVFSGEEINEIKTETKIVVEELKSTAKKELKAATKNIKNDKELKNL